MPDPALASIPDLLVEARHLRYRATHAARAIARLLPHRDAGIRSWFRIPAESFSLDLAVGHIDFAYPLPGGRTARCLLFSDTSAIVLARSADGTCDIHPCPLRFRTTFRMPVHGHLQDVHTRPFVSMNGIGFSTCGPVTNRHTLDFLLMPTPSTASSGDLEAALALRLAENVREICARIHDTRRELDNTIAPDLSTPGKNAWPRSLPFGVPFDAAREAALARRVRIALHAVHLQTGNSAIYARNSRLSTERPMSGISSFVPGKLEIDLAYWFRDQEGFVRDHLGLSPTDTSGYQVDDTGDPLPLFHVDEMLRDPLAAHERFEALDLLRRFGAADDAA